MHIDNPQIKVLHITPHLGGGVGRVVLNYLIKEQQNNLFFHEVFCLDYANDNAISIAKEYNIKLYDNLNTHPEFLLEKIKESDIVLVHWWNHPLLNDFFVRQVLPSSRVIFWSHISGFHPPYVFTKKALSYPDLFVFTTPLSFDTKEVAEFENKDNLGVVWSTGGVDDVKDVEQKSHRGFNIGYIGTVDYCKLHPEFLKICDSIDISEANFIVCGGSSHKEIGQEAKSFGIAAKFDFVGLVPDISEYLSIFDVFGYPLASNHYGTCDQVLAESMAAGVVPVVFDNPMEAYIVKDKETGLVVKNEEEYINAIKFLYQNPDYRKKLSENAKKYAVETFSVAKMASEWQKVFEKVLSKPKTSKKWDLNIIDVSAADIFVESLGGYGRYFREYLEAKNEESKKAIILQINEFTSDPIWKSMTRGTPNHYFHFFKEDKVLELWSKITNEELEGFEI